MNKFMTWSVLFIIVIAGGVYGTSVTAFSNKSADTEDYKFIVNVLKSCPEPTKVEVDFETYTKVKLTYNDVVVKINDYRRSGGNIDFDVYTLNNHSVYTDKELSEKTKLILFSQAVKYMQDDEVASLKKKYLGESNGELL